MKDDPRLPVPDSELRYIASLSALMRQKEAELASLSEKRRAECRRLVNGSPTHQRVSYQRLADAMGISDVAVYKILRGKGPRLRELTAERRAKAVEKERKGLGE